MKPYNECPRFNKCNANVCPLDPLSDARDTFEGEEVCRVEKPSRLRIGAKYPDLLPFVGYKKREYHAQIREAALTPAQREMRLYCLSKARKTLKTGIVESITDNSTILVEQPITCPQ